MDVDDSPFRAVPRTGVIFVTSEAERAGYHAGATDWCNLGQGQPETGALPGAPARTTTVDLRVDDQDYAPVAGLADLRAAVAELYNHRYRRGLPSQYTAENVAISSGGRVALTRAAASLGDVNLGHFLPDYTAYEELLDIFRAFTAIPILREPERGYAFTPADLQREIRGRGLSALLLSNPCNPTGKLIAGDTLAAWVAMVRREACALLVDEFYAHYVWSEQALAIGGQATLHPDRLAALPPGSLSESAARHVEDVNRDRVVIFDGLTKNWRYPGWRVAWTLGPQDIIERVASAGSFLDGGANRSIQRAAIPLLELGYVEAETAAIHHAFRGKREHLLGRLQHLGIEFDAAPEGTFYAWGNLAKLPPPFNDDMAFFRAALQHHVITVPGEFFDVNPGKRRRRRGRFQSHVRFSFGPPQDVLDRACDRMAQMLGER